MAMIQSAPFNRAVVIVPSNAVNFDGSTFSAAAATDPIPCEAIYVGGAGTVIAIFEDGSSATFTAIAGQILPLKAIRVGFSSTATLMLALYTI